MDTMQQETSLHVTLDDRDEALLLFGNRDQHLRAIRDALGVKLAARGDTIHIEGTEVQVEQAGRVFQQLRQIVQKQGMLKPEEVRTALAVVQQGDEREAPTNLAVVPGASRHVRPR